MIQKMLISDHLNLFSVYRDDSFSLVLFDPSRRYLHWMLVNISPEQLENGNFEEAIQVKNLQLLNKSAIFFFVFTGFGLFAANSGKAGRMSFRCFYALQTIAGWVHR